MQHATRLSSVPPPHVDGVVVLDFDARQKHRFLARLEGGQELAVKLPRGSVLADGDVLETDAGTAVRVRAAKEPLSVARTTDPLLLARLAYHLGNRHVALQIEPGKIAFRHDHVLDELAIRLGAALTFESAPFSPEGGAYGRGGLLEHRHAHEHDHAHQHEHEHEHEHGHEEAHDTVPDSAAPRADGELAGGQKQAPPLGHEVESDYDHDYDSNYDNDYGGEG